MNSIFTPSHLRRLSGLCALIGALFLFPGLAQAQQAAMYVFSHSIGTYTQVNDATATRLSSVEADSYISPAQNIGFTFTYGGTAYTQFKMSSNGFISFGSGTAVLTGNDLSAANASSRPIIAALWDDQDGRATGGISRAFYELTGSAPNRVLTVEWRNWEWNYSSSSPVISFQIKLYETTNVIEFIYRQESGSVASGSATIGIGSATGSGAGSYLNVTSVTSPAVSSTTAVNNLNTKPANDQVFTFSPPAPCAGQPATGQTTASVADACAGTPFTIGVSGIPVETGVTYEFESSPAGASSFTSLGPAQTSPTFTVANQTIPTDYRVIVTCTNSALSTTATQVSVGMNPFYNCYCTPASNCTNEGITNVSFGTLTNSSTFCNLTSGYTDYGGLGSLATVAQADQISLSVTATINSNPASAGVWIDYDHSGTFDASEYTSLGSSSGISPLPSTYVYTGTVTIDPNALTGITRMRVRQANQGGITSTSACTSTGVYGEYEDYLITIVAGTNCTGSPTAGTINGPSAVCPGVDFTLTATGYTTGVLGLSYQWQVYNLGTASWDPAPGTNNGTSYTVTGGISSPTDYRFSITCFNGGGVDYTNPVSLTINPVTQCYCIPATTSSSYYINNFTTTGGATNISNTSSGYSPAGYGDFTTTQSLSAGAGTNFNFSGTFGSSSTYTFGVKVWIDFGLDGSFAEPGDQVFATTGYTSSVSGMISIPLGTAPMTTRMRVGANYNSSTGPANACANFANGEYEDYSITILPAPTCLSPSALNASPVTTSGADLNWAPSASTPSSGYDYYYSTNNTAPGAGTAPSGSVLAGITTVSISGLNSSSTYYFWVRANCGNGDYSAWVGSSFMTLLGNDLPDGAVTLPVGGGCTGPVFTNAGGTYSPGEPPISCRGTNINSGSIVWYKFVAPASGFVRVSTDVSGNNLDTKLGLFTTSNPSNPSDLASFSIIGCDDDNGITAGTASTIYASGLTSGTTYYVAVDHYNGTSTNTFCVKVDEVTATMIAPSGSCAASSETPYSREDYTGWATIVDGQGRLIANARRTAATGSTSVYQYTGSLNVNTGAVRQAGSGPKYYLDRNFRFAYGQSSPATTFDLRLYFLDSELAALQAVDNLATLNNLNVTHQTGTTCVADYNAASGTNSLLSQTGNGSANNISWIEVNTPGFSNFYIMSGISPLEIRLNEISATNVGARNRVDWTAASTGDGDYFELERSADGALFTKIATVPAVSEQTRYTYWDETPLAGANYYRLKLADAAGHASYSATVKVVRESGTMRPSVSVYPNPFHQAVSVTIAGPLGSNPTITVMDLSGKVLKQLSATDAEITVDLRELPQGMYLLRYADDSYRKIMKMTKQ